MSININYGMTIMQSLKQLKATKLLSKRCVLKHTGWGLEYTCYRMYIPTPRIDVRRLRLLTSTLPGRRSLCTP